MNQEKKREKNEKQLRKKSITLKQKKEKKRKHTQKRGKEAGLTRFKWFSLGASMIPLPTCFVALYTKGGHIQAAPHACKVHPYQLFAIYHVKADGLAHLCNFKLSNADHSDGDTRMGGRWERWSQPSWQSPLVDQNITTVISIVWISFNHHNCHIISTFNWWWGYQLLAFL